MIGGYEVYLPPGQAPPQEISGGCFSGGRSELAGGPVLPDIVGIEVEVLWAALDGEGGAKLALPMHEVDHARLASVRDGDVRPGQPRE